MVFKPQSHKMKKANLFQWIIEIKETVVLYNCLPIMYWRESVAIHASFDLF